MVILAEKKKKENNEIIDAVVAAGKEAKMASKDKDIDDMNNDALDDSSEESAKFPFPRSVVVRLVRKNIDKGKQIKGRVKDELNWWLGDLVTKIAKKMNAHPYSYIDYGMFKDAISTYEKLEEIEHEKERIIKHLEKIKADIEMLEREVDKKFSL